MTNSYLCAMLMLLLREMLCAWGCLGMGLFFFGGLLRLISRVICIFMGLPPNPLPTIHIIHDVYKNINSQNSQKKSILLCNLYTMRINEITGKDKGEALSLPASLFVIGIYHHNSHSYERQ